MRFLEGESVRTYAARIATSTPSSGAATSSTSRLIGAYLAPGITDIAVGPKESLVYVVADPVGASVMQSDWRGGAQKKLLTIPLREWRVQVLPDSTVVLTQKASDGIGGYTFVLSTNGPPAQAGALMPLVENTSGLTVLAKDKATLIYGAADSSLTLYVRLPAQAGSPAGEVSLPLRTTADKCVWAHGTNLVAYCAVPRLPAQAGATLGSRTLLERYQGVRHTSDTWYRVNISAGTAEEIFAGDGSAAIDVEKPAIDAGNRYIAFTNAADKSLWMLRIAP